MMARQQDLNFPPGERHLYSNSGYWLMGQIIERATGLTGAPELIVYVGDQSRALGAAKFSRLEGSAYHRGVIYFASTQGGVLP